MAEFKFPPALAAQFTPYLPPNTPQPPQDAPHKTRPHVTLTYTTSLDSAITLSRGTPTALSGPESLGMTHFLRSQHDAILVGVGTLLADNPSLNCRLASPGLYPGADKRIRPVIVDADAKWDLDPDTWKVLRLAYSQFGLAPYVIRRAPPTDLTPNEELLLSHGGKIISVPSPTPRLAWTAILSALLEEGIGSIMIEGGASVISALLGPEGECVDSVIVTVAPRWLGEGSLLVSPQERAEVEDVVWVPMGRDVVMCGRRKTT